MTAAATRCGCEASPSGFPGTRGSLERRGQTWVLRSGTLPARDLDALPTPDWSLAQRHHEQRYPFIHYESSRGCPHNCAFCSFPHLFDAGTYRTKSAARIVEEWRGYARQGFRYISCLDSTFTTPRKRVRTTQPRLCCS